MPKKQPVQPALIFLRMKNCGGGSIYLKRSLDCLVIEYVHAARRKTKHPAYDSVLGVFEEGDRIYDGSGIRQYTHIQIAVRTPEIITGYFRVKGFKKPKS